MSSPTGHQYEKLDGLKETDDVQDRTVIRLEASRTRWVSLAGVLVVTLLASIACNVVLLLRTSPPRSPYTKLSHDLHGRFMGYHQPVYTSHNSTVKDQAWEAVNVGHGPVAIDTKLAQSRGLPPTRLWKPDRTKSVYLVAAYHALHCLPYIRRIVKSLEDGNPFTDVQRGHIDHCLDTLRSELMCTADDTLLASPLTPRKDGEVPIPGINQTRQCRDFEAIREWTMEHTACYLTVEDHPNATNYWNNCRSDGWTM